MHINKYNIMRDNKHDGLMQFIHGFIITPTSPYLCCYMMNMQMIQ